MWKASHSLDQEGVGSVNVLYDFQIFGSQRYGGISRYFYKLISQFVRDQMLGVLLFQGLHRNRYDLAAQRDAFSDYVGWRMDLPKTRRLCRIVNEVLFRRYLRENRERVDVYHLTYYSDKVPMGTVPCVVAMHDMIYELFREAGSPEHPVCEIKRRCVKAVDAVICGSQSARRDLIKHTGVDADKVTVVYHGNPMDPDEFRDVAPFANDRPYLLYVGNRQGLGGYKNFSIVVDLFRVHSRLVSDLRLVAFGGGAFERAEQSALNAAGLASRTRLVEGDDRMLASVYKGAACLVFPSLYEGFGMPVLEAMGFGCPVVASNRSSLPEVGGDAAVFFDPTDVDSLADAVASVRDDTTRRALIQDGFAQEKRFSWRTAAEQTAAVYRDAVARYRGSGVG